MAQTKSVLSSVDTDIPPDDFTRGCNSRSLRVCSAGIVERRKTAAMPAAKAHRALVVAIVIFCNKTTGNEPVPSGVANSSIEPRYLAKIVDTASSRILRIGIVKREKLARG